MVRVRDGPLFSFHGFPDIGNCVLLETQINTGNANPVNDLNHHHPHTFDSWWTICSGSCRADSTAAVALTSSRNSSASSTESQRQRDRSGFSLIRKRS